MPCGRLGEMRQNSSLTSPPGLARTTTGSTPREMPPPMLTPEAKVPRWASEAIGTVRNPKSPAQRPHHRSSLACRRSAAQDGTCSVVSWRDPRPPGGEAAAGVQTSSLRSGLGAADGLPGGLAVSGAAVAGGARYAGGLGAGGGRSRVSKSVSGMGRSKPTALWVIDSDRATAWSAWMRPSLRAAIATRVWQRQSMEWSGGGLGRGADGDAQVDVAQVAHRAGEFQVGGLAAQGLGVVEEFGAGGVAAGAAVVVGRVPAGQEADEQDRVDGFGGVGVAEPDPLAAFLAAGPHPGGELRRVAGSSAITVSMKFGLPARNSWPPDLGAVIAAAAISWATWRTVAARRSS